MTNDINSTLGRYCFRWGLVEAKAPAMFKDASICSKECVMYSEEYNTCIYRAKIELEIQRIKESLH